MIKETIQQITKNYVSRLPVDKSFYRLDDLVNYGFPRCLTHRLKLDLEDKLYQSVTLPKTEWADMGDQDIGKGWQQFHYRLRAAAHVPSNETESILKKAISDLIYILVQPRQTIPGLLFQEKSTLSAEEVQNRVKWLVVYPHFERVLTRYMERKERKELSRSRCEEIVTTVDEKLTKDYSALQWGQMLGPLFDLAGSPVESDMFRLFFEDRKMNGIAHKFGELHLELTQEKFVDTLFSFKEQEKDHYSKEKPDDLNKTEFNSPSVDHKKGNDELSGSQEREENSEHEPAPIGEQTPNEIKFDFKEPVDATREEETPKVHRDAAEEESDDSTEMEDNRNFGNSQPNFSEKQIENEQDSEATEKPTSLNEIFADQSEKSENKQRSESLGKEASEKPINASSKTQDNLSEPPIWQRFAEEEKDKNEAGLPNQNTSKQEADDGQSDFERYLQKDEEYFIASLFKGSKGTYRESLSNINRQSDWSEAYRLIDQQVFKPNMINMYSPEAVDFTDRLQTYFFERGK